MAKPEWGIKRTCFSCGARFYDLRRDPIICPTCSTVFDPARQPRPRRSGAGARDEAVAAPALAGAAVAGRGLDEETTEEGAETEVEELEEGADSDEDMDDLSNEDSEIIEDASELGEDDDDIGEVMEHVDDEMEDKA